MKKIVLRLSILLAAVVLLVLVPLLRYKPIQVHYMGTAMEYSPVDETVAIPHEVSYDGVLYQSILRKDYYRGTFYISDVPGVERGNFQEFRLNDNGWCNPYFDYPDQMQRPGMAGIATLFWDANFNTIAVQFFDHIETTENGAQAIGNTGTDHFLVTGTSVRSTALDIYRNFWGPAYLIG